MVKTPPTASTQLLLDSLAQGHQVTRFDLYKDHDYKKLVELIFAHEVAQS